MLYLLKLTVVERIRLSKLAIQTQVVIHTHSLYLCRLYIVICCFVGFEEHQHFGDLHGNERHMPAGEQRNDPSLPANDPGEDGTS